MKPKILGLLRITQQLKETNSNQHDLAQLNLNKPFISMSQYFSPVPWVASCDQKKVSTLIALVGLNNEH